MDKLTIWTFMSMFLFAACTDYVQKMDDDFEEWSQNNSSTNEFYNDDSYDYSSAGWWMNSSSSKNSIVEMSSSQRNSKISSLCDFDYELMECDNNSALWYYCDENGTYYSCSNLGDNCKAKNLTAWINACFDDDESSSDGYYSSSINQSVYQMMNYICPENQYVQTPCESNDKVWFICNTNDEYYSCTSDGKSCELSSYSIWLGTCAFGNSSANASLWSSSSIVISSGSFTDTRDGRKYKTVSIGSLVWMAENLNFETENSFCYESEKSNCQKFGRLYLRVDALDSTGVYSTKSSNSHVQGVCPPDWHLPSYEEWAELFNVVARYWGSDDNVVVALKSKTEWKSNDGEDAIGFNALPAGIRNADSVFVEKGSRTLFWHSSESGYRESGGLGFASDQNINVNGSLNGAFSIRCVHD